MGWLYKGSPFKEDITPYFGFVYLITNDITNQKYIGRKYFWIFRKNGEKRRKKRESNWRNYYGSCAELKDDIKKQGKANFTREILKLFKTKLGTNYEETRLQIENNVLDACDSNGNYIYYNRNILGRYFRESNYE